MAEVTIPTWPDSLPLSPLIAAFQEEGKSLARAVTSGNKSVIVRKIATRTQRPISVAFNLSAEQVETFEQFFYGTLDGGVGRFSFTHPRTTDVIEVSFDPSQTTAFTIAPQSSMRYFKLTAKFIIWT